MIRLKIGLLTVLTVSLFFSGCSKYQRLLKSDDYEMKYKKTVEYYEDEKYFKAYPLIEELIAVFRGTARAEKLYYMYAYSDYYTGDLLLASHRFTQFAKTFPTSSSREECLFMSAYCQYLMSPPPNLDQESTYQAIQELQQFINTHPFSDQVDTSTVLIEELREKLELKAFQSAKLYYKTENYTAAIRTFENGMQQFPDSEYRGESEFYIFKSHYELAMKSVPQKKIERMAAAEKAYVKFVDANKESPMLREAERLLTNLELEKPHAIFEELEYYHTMATRSSKKQGEYLTKGMGSYKELVDRYPESKYLRKAKRLQEDLDKLKLRLAKNK